MNRNQAVLLVIAILTLPLILFFIPEEKSGSVQSLAGVTLSNTSGEKFKFSGLFAEKKTLLVFWSITCGSCIEEIPFISRLHEKLGDRLNVIGVHPPGYPLQKIQRFVKKFRPAIPYQLAIDDEGGLIKAFDVSILPKTVLIDQRGEVLYAHVGYEETKEQEVENAIVSKL
jgi:thiol-disulfide isomerase/thioredoxin